MQTLGNRLRSALAALEKNEQRQISIAEVARRCGWGDVRQRVSNYMNDTRRPHLEEIEKLAEVLHCSPCWLAFGRGETALPRDEVQLVNAWRLATPERKDAVMALLPAPPDGGNSRHLKSV